MTGTLVVGLLTAVATLALTRPRVRLVALGRTTDRRGWGRRPDLLLPVAPLVAMALMSSGAGPIAVLAAVGVVGVVFLERRRSARRRARQAAAGRVEEAVSLLAAELRAGSSVASALAAASTVAPDLLAEPARLASLGGDPFDALRAASATPGAGSLADVAAGWRLAQLTGAPLATVLDRVRTLALDDLAAAREVDEQLAPVRATARLLAALPLLGLLMGPVFGVDVPDVLLTSGWGQACLLAAVVLVGLGLAAVHRIAEHAGAAA